jgi:hypothetical protein
MISRTEHPVSWAMLMFELSDAQEHLGALIEQMSKAGTIDDEDFSIQMGHIYAHLNRAWHGRDDQGLDDVPAEVFAERSKFPVDIKPIG